VVPTSVRSGDRVWSAEHIKEAVRSQIISGAGMGIADSLPPHFTAPGVFWDRTVVAEATDDPYPYPPLAGGDALDSLSHPSWASARLAEGTIYCTHDECGDWATFAVEGADDAFCDKHGIVYASGMGGGSGGGGDVRDHGSLAAGATDTEGGGLDGTGGFVGDSAGGDNRVDAGGTIIPDAAERIGAGHTSVANGAAQGSDAEGDTHPSWPVMFFWLINRNVCLFFAHVQMQQSGVTPKQRAFCVLPVDAATDSHLLGLHDARSVSFVSRCC
jgi:hypothetical protein